MLRNLRNALDFKLRNALRWSPRLPADAEVHAKAALFQTEVAEFLKLFDWQRLLRAYTDNGGGVERQTHLVAADVGARTFAMAPVIDKLFADHGMPLELHGIEIDAYRRFTNFLTRAEYGQYYAKKIRNGHFHALDFMEWQKPLDLVFLLHPFVTPEPLLNWGLPLRHFKPQPLFDHCRALLGPRAGYLVLSSPSADEFAVAQTHAGQSGFRLWQRADWLPRAGQLQGQPRFGAIYCCD